MKWIQKNWDHEYVTEATTQIKDLVRFCGNSQVTFADISLTDDRIP